tara:strand:+ start:2469 stop:2738 length:270 start_codon:yes stop_codon:yes gene_type:complete
LGNILWCDGGVLGVLRVPLVLPRVRRGVFVGVTSGKLSVPRPDVPTVVGILFVLMMDFALEAALEGLLSEPFDLPFLGSTTFRTLGTLC